MISKYSQARVFAIGRIRKNTTSSL